jgi:hypothetical protein
MKSASTKRFTLLFALVLAGLAVFAASASAADRNHDGIRDRWEAKHHLSLKVNQARRDQDRDGTVNKCEFQAGTDPRSADSDRDGTRDGAEDIDDDGITNRGESRLHSNCGRDSNKVEVENATIASFVDNVLTVDLPGGGVLTAPVAADLRCEFSGPGATPPTGVAISSHGSDDGHGDDDASGDDDGPGHDLGDDHGDDEHAACTTADLVAGAIVREAKIRDGLFVKIELKR